MGHVHGSLDGANSASVRCLQLYLGLDKTPSFKSLLPHSLRGNQAGADMQTSRGELLASELAARELCSPKQGPALLGWLPEWCAVLPCVLALPPAVCAGHTLEEQGGGLVCRADLNLHEVRLVILAAWAVCCRRRVRRGRAFCGGIEAAWVGNSMVRIRRHWRDALDGTDSAGSLLKAWGMQGK